MIHNSIVHNGETKWTTFAIYLEPWHADIFEFLELKKESWGMSLNEHVIYFMLYGSPDLFMERVKNNDKWSFNLS